MADQHDLARELLDLAQDDHVAAHALLDVAAVVRCRTTCGRGRKRTEVETVQRKALRLVRIDADIEIYFCDPHAPWQRATNENTNGLLRQYFPKGSDLSVHTAADLDAVADELNDRPRKRLRFAKPIEEIGPLPLR